MKEKAKKSEKEKKAINWMTDERQLSLPKVMLRGGVGCCKSPCWLALFERATKRGNSIRCFECGERCGLRQDVFSYEWDVRVKTT